MHTAQIIAQIAAGILILLCWIWGSLAIFVAGPESIWLKYLLLVFFILTLPLVLYLDLAFWQKLLSLVLVFVILMIWWVPMKATNDKDWAPEIAKIPHGEFEDNILVLQNVRNFKYTSRTKFTEHWETRRYDMEQLESLDIILSYWGSPHIAHVVMSWGFSNGDHLAISIETRKDKHQVYSALKGFFKQYTLAYVAADERDLIRLRTNYRKEQVVAYRIQNIPEQYKRYLLDSYIKHMNKLVDEPEFYHALLENCTAGISAHYKVFKPDASWIDWRLIANGHLDGLLYDLKLIRTDMPFEELQTQSRVDIRMQELGEEDFSANLRKGVAWENFSTPEKAEKMDGESKKGSL